jgi:hypothetical protein
VTNKSAKRNWEPFAGPEGVESSQWRTGNIRESLPDSAIAVRVAVNVIGLAGCSCDRKKS